MILDQYEGISFVHPMKTAMTSVETFFRKMMRRYRPGEPPIMHFNEHMTPDEILWRFDYPVDIWGKYYCVLFVRNPYDRLVSFYHHMRQIGGYAEGICKRLTFREFALHVDLAKIMCPMVDYLYCEGKSVINFLGRFELLNQSVARLIDLIDFGGNEEEVRRAWPAYTHAMKTEHESYQSYYDDRAKEYVYEQYRKDFEIFGYEVM